MKVFDATKAKNQFGILLQESLVEPVAVRKTGRIVSVMVSAQEYERLSAIEDAYWGEKALKAEQEGYLDTEESLHVFTERMNEIAQNNASDRETGSASSPETI